MRNISLPGLDFEYSWSRIFNMIKKSFMDRNFLYEVVSTTYDQSEYQVNDVEWECAYRVEGFLELTACVTKQHSGSIYLSFSFKSLEFSRLH